MLSCHEAAHHLKQPRERGREIERQLHAWSPENLTPRLERRRNEGGEGFPPLTQPNCTPHGEKILNAQTFPHAPRQIVAWNPWPSCREIGAWPPAPTNGAWSQWPYLISSTNPKCTSRHQILAVRQPSGPGPPGKGEQGARGGAPGVVALRTRGAERLSRTVFRVGG